MRNKQIDWLVFTLFLLIVFFLRLPSFFKSAFGPDESLYLLMARSLTEGHPPYTVFFDHKPTGIYILFALALLIFGKSVIAIRILACIFVAITCYLLYRLGNIISKNDKKVGLLAGILYAILSLSNGGLSSNTEIFYTTFVVLAFYLLWDVIANSGQRISQNSLRLFLIGLAMGIGFQIKQVVMFDFIAILMIVGLHMYHYLNSRRSLFAKLCKCYILLEFGFFVPFVTVCLYFLVNGNFADYVYANFTANLARVSDESLAITDFAISFLIQIQSNILLWVCLFLTPFTGYLLKIYQKSAIYYI